MMICTKRRRTQQGVMKSIGKNIQKNCKIYVKFMENTLKKSKFLGFMHFFYVHF